MTELRRIYRVNSPDLGELNRVLADMADRMDQLEGYRGKGDFKTIPSSSQGASESTDLARYGDVITYADSAASSAAGGVFGFVIVTISANTLKIYAQDDGVTVLHGMGDLV
jgi:hypothetical protein